MPIRSRWTDQFTELPSQSKFHNKVREILVSDPILKGFFAYQEVPVKDLCEDYDANHYFDWYIEELNLVVELHGAQHYKVVNFGNISYEAAQSNFRDIRKRDRQKKEAAEASGLFYLEISHKEYKKLDADRLKELLFGAST